MNERARAEDAEKMGVLDRRQLMTEPSLNLVEKPAEDLLIGPERPRH
jgi:hypothetical protein